MINYAYTVISVDEAARCMEIVYTSDGNPTTHIGARLPYAGETLETVVAMYAPVQYWAALKTPVTPVSPGANGTVVVPTPPPPDLAREAVAKRNHLLQSSDWTQLPDAPVSEEFRAQWVAYRRALRDVPSQPGFPTNISWPTQPGISVTVA